MIGQKHRYFRNQLNCGINMGRYNRTSRILYRTHETLGRFKTYPWLIDKPSDSLIGLFKVTNQNAGEPRRIASAVYGDHNLFWVLAAFNDKWYADPGAKNVFNWPVAGQVIYYPLFSVISSTIS